MDFIDYISDWAVTENGQFHLIVAIMALILGPITFLMRKRSLGHRWAGYLFIIVMLVTNITALLSYNLTGGFNLFHFAALASLGTLFLAIFNLYKALKSKTEKYYILHGIYMSWTYFGLVAAFIAEVYTREFPYMLHGEGGWTRFSLSISLFLFIAGYGVFKITSRIIPKIVKSPLK